MKTKFTFKNGAVRNINHKAAHILQKAGKGTYQTRDLVAERPAPEPVLVKEPDDYVLEHDGFDLESLDRDQLYDLAKERGIDVHHRAGADRIRAALKGE